MSADLVNGLFESIGSVLLWMNVRRLYLDKKIMGVNIAPVVFWSLWGMWNLFYYPHLNQWYSFAGGVSVMLANSVWVVQAIHYRGLTRLSGKG